MKRSYKPEPVADDGWSSWIRPIQPGYRISCCDCGLVHDFEFRVTDGNVEFRARINERSTAQVRRHKTRKSA